MKTINLHKNANSSDEILTNGTISAPFRLYRGTRQGCLLSPLLFTLAIKQLAMAICNHTHISGITIGSSGPCISLYADDIIIFSSSLKQSIPALLNVIETFGELSGNKINNSKPVLLFLHKAESLHLSFYFFIIIHTCMIFIYLFYSTGNFKNPYEALSLTCELTWLSVHYYFKEICW